MGMNCKASKLEVLNAGAGICLAVAVGLVVWSLITLISSRSTPGGHRAPISIRK